MNELFFFISFHFISFVFSYTEHRTIRAETDRDEIRLNWANNSITIKWIHLLLLLFAAFTSLWWFRKIDAVNHWQKLCTHNSAHFAHIRRTHAWIEINEWQIVYGKSIDKRISGNFLICIVWMCYPFVKWTLKSVMLSISMVHNDDDYDNDDHDDDAVLMVMMKRTEWLNASELNKFKFVCVCSEFSAIQQTDWTCWEIARSVTYTRNMLTIAIPSNEPPFR